MHAHFTDIQIAVFYTSKLLSRPNIVHRYIRHGLFIGGKSLFISIISREHDSVQNIKEKTICLLADTMQTNRHTSSTPKPKRSQKMHGISFATMQQTESKSNLK